MFYIGMSSVDTFDVVETPIYNEEVREILEYFYGQLYSLTFVIEGQKQYIKRYYEEPIENLIKEWEHDIDWKADNKQEYMDYLNRLKEIIG